MPRTLGEVERELAYDARRWPLEWTALEELLAFAQFEEGTLDDRLRPLPTPLYARAAFLAYVLGWVNQIEEE
jgi:hypothetical protein